MRKILITILVLILYINSNAQSPLRINKYLIDSLTGSGYWYLYHDSTHTGQWGLVAGSGGGGGGSGTVTSITQAYGIINTPNPITSTGTVKFDSATVFPQLRATIPANTDSLFGVQDNSLAQNRYVNGHGSYGMELDSLSYFFFSGRSGTSIEMELMSTTPHLDYFVTSPTGYGVSQSSQGGTTSADWIVGATGGGGNQYFSADAGSTSQVAQIGSFHNVAGRWIDSRYESQISSTNVAQSAIEQWLEQWTGSATQRFTNVRYRMDSIGFAIQTYRRAGAYDPTRAAYKGILVDTSSNVRFENYPSSRNDGGFPQKVLYSSNSSGDLQIGYLDTTFYQTKAATKKTTDSVVSLISGGSGWSLSGNSLTAGSQTGDFIGSTNNVSMRFRTNNTQAMVIDSNGSVLVNKATAYSSGGDALIVHAKNTSAFQYALMVEDNSSNPLFYIENSSRVVIGSFLSGFSVGASTPSTFSGTVALNAATTMAARFLAKQGADVASAAGAIALGTDGNVFEITGTNTITLISGSNWQNGSVVILAFTSTATLTDGTANSGSDIGMELAGNTNFVASAGATITLVLSEIGGTQRWREAARSVQ